MDAQSTTSSSISKHRSTEGSELDEEFRYLTLPPASATFTDAGSTTISTPATTPPPPESATFGRKTAFAGGPSPRHSSQYSPMAPPPKLPLPALPPSSTFSSPRSSVSTQLSSASRPIRHQQQQQASKSSKRGPSHSPSPPSTSSGYKSVQLRLNDMPPRSPRDPNPTSGSSNTVIVESPTRMTHQQHRKRNSIDDAHRRAATANPSQQKIPTKSTLESLFSERGQSEDLFRDYTPTQGHINAQRGPSHSSQGKASNQSSRSTNINKNALMLNTAAARRDPAQHQQQRYVHQPRLQQEANGDDVIMNDETSTMADQQTDFDEGDFEYLNLPKVNQAAMERKISSRNDNFEAAWADDASCIDVSDRYQESEEVEGPPEETFEVAALRRQVEQLQMALQRQMATQRQTSARAAQQKRSMAEMRVPFGMPTPSKSFDSGSTLQNRSTSSKASYRGDQSSDADQFTEYSDTFGADRRRLQPHRSQGQLSHPYMDSFGGAGSVPFRKGKRGSIVSSLFDESASTLGRKEDTKKVDELAKKIEALEKMFQTSSVSSMSPTDERQQLQYLATNDVRRSPIEERHSPISPRSFAHNRMELQQNDMLRKTSMATMSDRDGGRRSPAASAFHFNPTTFTPEEYAATMGRLRNNSSGSINTPNGRTKSVARFIMGVGSSRSNVPRDEYGNPLPSMQVSWSRKRTEKVAKPTTQAKMKVGPGRGRIVMKAPPS